MVCCRFTQTMCWSAACIDTLYTAGGALLVYMNTAPHIDDILWDWPQHFQAKWTGSVYISSQVHTHTVAPTHKYTNIHCKHTLCLSRLGHYSPEEPSKPDQNPYWPAAVLTRSQLGQKEKKREREPQGTTWFWAVLATAFNAITGMLSCVLDASLDSLLDTVKARHGGAAQAIGNNGFQSRDVVAFCLCHREGRSQVRISET